MFDQLLVALALACVGIPLCLIALLSLMAYAAANNVALVSPGGGMGPMALSSEDARAWPPTFVSKGMQITGWWLAIALPIWAVYETIR